jgi:exopolysaccharide production protein ExoQ
MRSLTKSNAPPQIDGLIYSKVAELLFIGLLLVFIYPFFFVISGVDPTLPTEEQSPAKLVYFLQVVFPFSCIGIALMCRGSDLCLPGAIMIYPIVCLASIIWSVNPYDTLKYATLMFLYVLAIAAVCQVLDIGVFCKVIARVLVFLILASLAMAVAFPEYGTHQLTDMSRDVHDGEWRGVFLHKNLLGATACISVFIFLFLGRLTEASLALRVTCIVAAIACLIFAQSAGSWVATCVLLVYLCLIRSAPVSGNVLMLIVVGVSALALGAFLPFSDHIAAVLGRDATFTGRTDIWALVLDAVWQKPLLGFGYAVATGDFKGISPVQELGAGHAHNGYLDVLLGTGAVGLVLLIFSILSVVVTAISRLKTCSGLERDCLMLLLFFPITSLVFSFFEAFPISDVQNVLGALNFLSLTAIPLYLRGDRARHYPKQPA